jgi:hypothetical protein
MKTLEQEAEEYFDNNIFCDGITPFEEDISKRCFMAGAKSNYVQSEKIKAQIDMLKSIGTVHDERCMSQRVRDKIRELEQQLKQLEDET